MCIYNTHLYHRNIKMNLAFSIIIPAYNSEEYLSECLDSITSQNFKQFEIIIIDDGSTDKTAFICDDYKKKFNNIKVIHQNNQGVSIARSNGVAIAKGEYLLFCDSDDLFQNEALENIYNIIMKTKVDVICFNMTSNIKDLSKKETGKYYSKFEIERDIFPYLLEDKYGKYFAPEVCGAAFKKNLYTENQVDKYRIEIGEDLACKKAVLFNANSLYIMDSILYYYRRHGGSATLCNKVFPIDGPKLIGKHLEEKIDLNLLDMQDQLYRVVTHQLFLVVLSQFNNEEYQVNKTVIEQLLDDLYYKKAVTNCHYSITYVKGNIAKICMKYKMFRVLKIISKLYEYKYKRV
ncbi:Glycosyl transferase family 2 [Kandleria vitulina]|uniref:glycosyltransferase family 2 protein n=1 Tax=Kandleria vitulina TaxID=1630 RepID=UPI0008C25651|nr:glycosyltransferase family 2 protein [Kandleria vitulina]SEI98934.1 Glycosyl transferase family 2 [Kandleria vitulina]